MNTRTVKFIDSSGNVVAVANVVEEDRCYGGTIDLQRLPASLRSLFAEWEEVVNDQMFSFLDELQQRIEALALRALFENGQAVGVKDLQIYPQAGDVSFKLADVPAGSTKLA